MKELSRTQTSNVIGGLNCDRLGRRIIRRYEAGKDVTDLANRYVDGGCLDEAE